MSLYKSSLKKVHLFKLDPDVQSSKCMQCRLDKCIPALPPNPSFICHFMSESKKYNHALNLSESYHCGFFYLQHNVKYTVHNV